MSKETARNDSSQTLESCLWVHFLHTGAQKTLGDRLIGAALLVSACLNDTAPAASAEIHNLLSNGAEVVEIANWQRSCIDDEKRLGRDQARCVSSVPLLHW